MLRMKWISYLLVSAVCLSCLTTFASAKTEIAKPDHAASSALPPEEAQEEPAVSYTNEQMLSMLHGTWKGILHTVISEKHHIEDPVTMNFIAAEPKMYLTVKSFEARYIEPNSWWIDNSELYFSLGYAHWGASVQVSFEDENTLVGTYSQYGKSFPITLRKTGDAPVDYGGTPQFVFEGYSYESWFAKLYQYSSFTQTPGAGIPYSYELNRWDKTIPLTYENSLYYTMYDMSDVDKMITLLNLICDNYKHDGNSGMPEQWDIQSIDNYYKKAGVIDCRGLSILLAEMLNASGVPSKVIMCIPDLEPCEESHVVVHAYSQSLGQWIMLDPTYRLMLKNEDGQYVSLPMLRDALTTGQTLIPNDNAGHNGMPFYMPYYRAYMTKNAFRFSNATKFYPGSEKAKGNVVNMLTPKGWAVPYINSRPEKVTTNAAAFWAPPVL